MDAYEETSLLFQDQDQDQDKEMERVARDVERMIQKSPFPPTPTQKRTRPQTKKQKQEVGLWGKRRKASDSFFNTFELLLTRQKTIDLFVEGTPLESPDVRISLWVSFDPGMERVCSSNSKDVWDWKGTIRIRGYCSLHKGRGTSFDRFAPMTGDGRMKGCPIKDRMHSPHFAISCQTAEKDEATLFMAFVPHLFAQFSLSRLVLEQGQAQETTRFTFLGEEGRLRLVLAPRLPFLAKSFAFN